MSIQSRINKVKECNVWPLDSRNGRATYLQVDTDHSKYHVALPQRPAKIEVKLTSERTLTAYEYKTTCREWPSYKSCKGNSNGTICYHSLAAIEHRVRVNGKTLVKPDDGELSSAIKLLNLGGSLVKLTNQAGNSKWGVVR